MTWCMGLVHGGSVYLLGDSAVTVTAGPTGPALSSFGEVRYDGVRQSVAEAALKLVEIAPGCAVAMAGDPKRAAEGVELLRTFYDESLQIPDLLSVLSNSIEPDSPDEFTLLVGRVSASGPELWRWSSTGNAGAEHAEFMARIGGFNTWHVQATREIASVLSNQQVDEAQVLSVMAAVVQSYGLQDVLLSHSAGGIFTGLHLSASGTSWLEDTAYVVYDNQFNCNFVIVYCREGATVVYSSYTSETRVFFGGLFSNSEIGEWKDKWIDVLEDRFKVAAAKNYVFLSVGMHSAFIVDAGLSAPKTSSFALTEQMEDACAFAISDLFMRVLLAPAPARVGQGERSTPIRLTYGNTENLDEQVVTLSKVLGIV
jgi:hypothetical protein